MSSSYAVTITGHFSHTVSLATLWMEPRNQEKVLQSHTEKPDTCNTQKHAHTHTLSGKLLRETSVALGSAGQSSVGAEPALDSAGK